MKSKKDQKFEAWLMRELKKCREAVLRTEQKKSLVPLTMVTRTSSRFPLGFSIIEKGCGALKRFKDQ
jgi:hypothetical protein